MWKTLDGSECLVRENPREGPWISMELGIFVRLNLCQVSKKRPHISYFSCQFAGENVL